MKKIANIIAIILFTVGFFVFLYPVMINKFEKAKENQTIRVFCESFGVPNEADPNEKFTRHNKDEVDEATSKMSDEDKESLYKEMADYNQKIYEDGQAELKDAFSYTTNDFDFNVEGLDKDMIGYLVIDKMDVRTPLYIGASADHMRKGASILNQTSMPLGGENTNCVIASHRGYRGADYFKDIEKLEPGDLVTVVTLFETLNYRVEKSIVIHPDDIDQVKIKEGIDMITLSTCHPYGSTSSRYLVYCVRDESQQIDSKVNVDAVTFADGITYEPSQKDIDREDFIIRLLCVIALILDLITLKVIGNTKKSTKKE